MNLKIKLTDSSSVKTQLKVPTKLSLKKDIRIYLDVKSNAAAGTLVQIKKSE